MSTQATSTQDTSTPITSAKTTEQRFHLVRWGLAIGWLVLIASLFYDPISAFWTDPQNQGSPMRDMVIAQALDPATCVKVQNVCLEQAPYPIATRIFWGMVIPSGLFIVLVFGHEVWRRICPLYFMSQIPRALGLKPLLDIHRNQWLQRNHFYVQFGLFFLGLNVRILLVNSNRVALGSFLVLTILGAIAMVILYGGRSWCHYICPFGMVQTVFTGPRGLLGSEAHLAPAGSLTQSMCRTVTADTVQSACIGCKSPCLDIDSEKTYWQALNHPGRRLVQYGYLGLVVGYLLYYYLYAGNWKYYFSGAWSHEADPLSTLLHPGFYLAGQSLNIPKVLAAPLTLAGFAGLGYALGINGEMIYRQWRQRSAPYLSREVLRHQMFSISTFLAFNIFFIYGGRPEVLRWSMPVQLGFQAILASVSILWLCRVWHRNPERYEQESLADKLRRQLQKLNLDFSDILGQRSLAHLSPAEVHVLAKTLPLATQRDRLQIYRGVLQDALASGLANSRTSLKLLEQLRASLEISELQHSQILGEIQAIEPLTMAPFFFAPAALAQTEIRVPRAGAEQFPATQIRARRGDR